MKFPFKAKLTDHRYAKLVYVITVKDAKDWDNLKSLEENPQYTVEPLTKKAKQVEQRLERD